MQDQKPVSPQTHNPSIMKFSKTVSMAFYTDLGHMLDGCFQQTGTHYTWCMRAIKKHVSFRNKNTVNRWFYLD